MKSRVVGLDIGANSVKAVQVNQVGPQSWVVEKQGALPLEAGLIFDGRVAEGKTRQVATVIARLWASVGFDTKDVIIGFNSSSAVFMSEEIVPLMKPDDMKKSLPVILAAKNPNLNPAENLIDWTVVEELEGDEGRRHLRVLVYSVRTNYAQEITDLVESAGLNVIGADFNALAALRAVDVGAQPPGALDALVDIGGNLTVILLHHNGVPRLLTLDPDSAGAAASARIAEALGLDEDDEADAKTVEYHKVNDDNAVGLVAQARTEYSRALAGKVAANLRAYVERTPEFDHVANVALVGGGALLHGLSAVLREALPETTFTYAPVSSAISAQTGGPVERNEPISGGDYLVAIGLGTGARI